MITSKNTSSQKLDSGWCRKERQRVELEGLKNIDNNDIYEELYNGPLLIQIWPTSNDLKKMPDVAMDKIFVPERDDFRKLGMTAAFLATSGVAETCLDVQETFLECAKTYNIVSAKFNLLKGNSPAYDVILGKQGMCYGIKLFEPLKGFENAGESI